MGMIVVSYVYYSLNKVRWMVVDQIVGFVSGQLGQLLWRFEIVDCKVVLGNFFRFRYYLFSCLRGLLLLLTVQSPNGISFPFFSLAFFSVDGQHEVVSTTMVANVRTVEVFFTKG